MKKFRVLTVLVSVMFIFLAVFSGCTTTKQVEVIVMPEVIPEVLPQPEPVRPEIEIISIMTGDDEGEILEKTKTVIEVNLVNIGDFDEVGLTAVLTVRAADENQDVLIQEIDVDNLVAAGEKKLEFEIITPDVLETGEIHYVVEVVDDIFGELVSKMYMLKVVDGEYKRLRSIKEVTTKDEKKELSLQYLAAAKGDEIEGRYEKEVETILEDILWRQVKYSCSKKRCEEYMNVFPEETAKHRGGVKKKLEEIDECKIAKKTHTYRGYQAFVKKYKKSACANSIKRRTNMPYWAKKKTKNSHVSTQIGEIYRDRGEPEEAVEAFQEALRFDNDNVAAYIGIGSSFLTLKDIEAAKVNLLVARELERGNFKINYMLATIYANEEGESRQAFMYFSAAIEENQECLKCYYFRARLNMKVLRLNDAKSDFREVIEIANNTENCKFYCKNSKSYLEKLSN